MTADLSKIAKERKIKYFLISYTDLFGVLRAKLAPAAAIGDMQRDGAGFAGFATWLDMTPAHPDLFARPDPDSLIQLPWKPEVGWLASDLWMDGKEVADCPRAQLKKMVALAAKNGQRMKSGVECEFFLITPDGKSLSDAADTPGEALLRPAGPDAPLRRHHRNLRCHAQAGLEAVSERPRGRQRPVRDELAL